MIAILFLLMSIASIQIGSSFAKTLFPLIGPLPTVLLRVAIAAIIMLVVFQPWKTRLTKQAWKYLLLYGICLGLMNCAFYFALLRIPLGVCVALEFTGPLAVALLSSKKKIDVLWVLFAAIGVWLILPFSLEGEKLDLVGIIFALLAGTGWALYIVFGKKVSALVEEKVAVSIGLVVAAIVTLPFGLATLEPSQLTSHVWLMGLLVAVLASAIPYTLEMYALKKVSTLTFGTLMSLEPAMAALSGMVVLKEHLTTNQWTAISCIIIASAGSVSDMNVRLESCIARAGSVCRFCLKRK